MDINWNFLFDKTKLLEIFKKAHESSYRDFYLSFSILSFLFLGSAIFLFRMSNFPNLIGKAKQVIEKKQYFQMKKELLEDESKRTYALDVMGKILLDVMNTHQKKELELVTQFQGFENLKGHEGKLLLENYNFESIFKPGQSKITKPYQETPYSLSEPLILTDLELKRLITHLDELRFKRPSILITTFNVEKKMIDQKDRYQVNFTFVLREKMRFNRD